MTKQPIISIENLSKSYRLGEYQPSYSLRDTIVNFSLAKKPREEFWALKNINYEIFPGDTVGIIGKNGAGKSTLLKILSRITPPTTGKITARGRIASLLEVGTGFSPELTGRENIYLNGSILGMKKAEINSKFEEIVTFAGIEKFLDTPVKRYSSGMYVRLAFAVAAHLEPEILLVDEVLAVGDAEFQKKCLGKMSEVSKQGRTVIFVSHNMGAVAKLCAKAILLENGQNICSGKTELVISKYLKENKLITKELVDLKEAVRWPGSQKKIFTWISLHDPQGKPTSIIYTGSDMYIRIGYETDVKLEAYLHIIILNELGERVAVVHTKYANTVLHLKGKGYIECRLDNIRMLSGKYTLLIETGKAYHNEWLDNIPEAIKFIVRSNKYLDGHDINNTHSSGYIAQRSTWNVYAP